MAMILVTGSGKGIGRAITIELARRGHEVVATARRLETLRDLPVARRITLDVTDEASVRRAREEVGPVDVLVNNAGDIAVAPIESTPFEEVRNLYDLNVFGTLRMVQAFGPAMRERGSGTIINMSSMAGRVAMPLIGMYSSTKWAIEGLSEALRFELGHFGVRVLLIEPGSINSGALDNPRGYFREGDPYLPLAGQSRSDPSQMTSTETVARTVANAVEAPERQFRWPVGDDAERLLGARAELDDAAFDSAFRASLGFTW
jgi:NAD(P)-dependent dehydrogenase (short-subunit alcohol dehydrogenase family)